MDTSKDIRIQFVEKVVASLREQAKKGVFGSLRRHPRVLEELEEMASAAMTMKHCYLEPAAIASMPEREALVEKGDAVLDLLAELAGDDRQKRACLRFFRLALRQLGPALALPASLESCVPVEAGTVATVSKHPGAKNLVVTRVDVFGESLQIVTNLVKTRAGQRMKVALVYPAEVMGVLSEAQFVGGEAQAGESGRVDLAPDERQEVRRSLGAFMDGRGP